MLKIDSVYKQIKNCNALVYVVNMLLYDMLLYECKYTDAES